uniref:Uncharacterized protein n=1 Tax=Xiphophorus couchianus TaxID=32473 RepID=A0A3B5LLY1_9TELE
NIIMQWDNLNHFSPNVIFQRYTSLQGHCTLCEFEGRRYALGETWMDNACMQCTLTQTPRIARCPDAHSLYPVTCKAFLVQTADPRLPWPLCSHWHETGSGSGRWPMPTSRCHTGDIGYARERLTD